MMAGRDISTTKLAMGSTRVMGTCAVGGQAVGTAAALAVKNGMNPREFGISHIFHLFGFPVFRARISQTRKFRKIFSVCTYIFVFYHIVGNQCIIRLLGSFLFAILNTDFPLSFATCFN